MRRRRSEQEGGGARGRLEGGAEPRSFTCEGGEEGQEKKKDDTVSAKTLIECIAKGEKKKKKSFEIGRKKASQNPGFLLTTRLFPSAVA